MNDAENQFIRELEKELGNFPDKGNIVAEYKLHIFELAEDNGTATYDDLIRKLGTPREIAKVWKQENGVTPKKTQWLFVLLNISLFLGGTLLILCYHIFNYTLLLIFLIGFIDILYL